jgi:hypothetical protein
MSPTVLPPKCLDRYARTASQTPFTSPPRWPRTSIVRKRTVAARLYYIYFVNANTHISIAVWCNLQTLCQEYSGLLCTSFTTGGTYVASETCRKRDTIRALAYRGMCGRAQPFELLTLVFAILCFLGLPTTPCTSTRDTCLIR